MCNLQLSQCESNPTTCFTFATFCDYPVYLKTMRHNILPRLYVKVQKISFQEIILKNFHFLNFCVCIKISILLSPRISDVEIQLYKHDNLFTKYKQVVLLTSTFFSTASVPILMYITCPAEPAATKTPVNGHMAIFWMPRRGSSLNGSNVPTCKNNRISMTYNAKM